MTSVYFVKVISDLYITKPTGQFFAFILLDLAYDAAHQLLLPNILSSLGFQDPSLSERSSSLMDTTNSSGLYG